MKKTISLFVSMFLLISSFSNVINAEEVTDNIIKPTHSISFENESFDGLSELEVSKNKMKMLGFDDEWINSLSEEEVLKYKDVLWGTVITKYYKETSVESTSIQSLNSSLFTDYLLQPNEDQKSSTLIEVSEKEFLEASERAKQEKQLPMPVVKGIITPKASSSFSKDGGYLKLEVNFSYLGSAKYSISSRYEWTTNPKYRGKEVFGITRSELMSIIPNTYYSVTKYTKDNYSVYCSGLNGAITYTWLNGNEYWTERSSMEYGSGYTSAIVSPSLYYDSYPATMTWGSFASASLYAGFKGYMSYQGIIAQPNQANNLNIYGVYHHQKSSYTGSLSINYPWGVSFTVSPAAKYDSATVTELIRYTP